MNKDRRKAISDPRDQLSQRANSAIESLDSAISSLDDFDTDSICSELDNAVE